MRIAPVVEVKAKFSAYLEESKSGPVIVTKNGKAVAVLLAVEDEDELERLILAYSPKFLAIMRQGKAQIKAGEVFSHEEFWEEVEAEAT
jgi:prevent-host-death family protein